jgi:hypothetical protein
VTAAQKKEVFLGSRPVPVWPEGQGINALNHPTIISTRFTDTELYHPRLAACILERAGHKRTGKQYFRGAGGTKTYHVDQWNCSEADLIHARALALFRRALNCTDAVVDLSWANVYRRGEYCMPHSHLRSTASIVYFLESGDDDPDDPLSGRFYFADPRLPGCCKEEADKMTTPTIPDTAPGTMIIFPSQVIHCVNPYSGERPRMTMSWNVSQTAVPGAALPPSD